MAGVDEELVQFCENTYPRLIGVLALYLGDRHVAEELAQETLVRVHQHWRRIRSSNPEAWANRVALNLASSWWRRRHAERRANARHGSAPERAAHADPTDVLVVRAAVAGLPQRQRAALVLRYYAELPVAEVASHLHCAEGTVRALTHQAIVALRAALVGNREPHREEEASRA